MENFRFHYHHLSQETPLLTSATIFYITKTQTKLLGLENTPNVLMYVYKTVPSYVRWMRSLDDQSQGIQHLLSWIDSTSEIQRTILTVIRRNLIMMTMKVLMPQRKTFMPMTNLTIMILMNLTIMILVNLTIKGLRVGIRDYTLPKNMPDCGFKSRIMFNCLVLKMLRGILGLPSFESFLINQAMLCLN